MVMDGMTAEIEPSSSPERQWDQGRRRVSEPGLRSPAGVLIIQGSTIQSTDLAFKNSNDLARLIVGQAIPTAQESASEPFT